MLHTVMAMLDKSLWLSNGLNVRNVAQNERWALEPSRQQSLQTGPW